MNAVLSAPPEACPATPAATAMEAALAPVQEVIRQLLAPQVAKIDTEALYPHDVMRALGQAGAYRGAVSPDHGGNGLGLSHVIAAMTAVSRECVSTGFLVWCQTACARYIDQSRNDALKAELLPRILSGEQMVGTGLSNTIKSYDEIEAYRLSARRVEGGYEINGVLPWVSNLGADHFFTTGCPVVNAAEGEGPVFVVVDCAQPGFKLVECAHFLALDSTRTMACHFKDVFIPDSRVLAHPAESRAYVRRIKPGMILGQMGMGLGLAEACIELMRQSNRTHSHVNCHLDDQVDDLAPLLAEAQQTTHRLAQALLVNPLAEVVVDVLRTRLAGGELAMRCAHAAMLHLGAKGYLMRSPAQRRLREAYFVGIVTPATKHLRREIARLTRTAPELNAQAVAA